MKHVLGNLLDKAEDGEFDVIVQGCNCFNTMGAGIALTIRNRYPQAYEADCKTKRGDRAKLGTYTCAEVGMGIHSFTVVNAYTQYHFGATKENPDLFEYNFFRQVLKQIRADFPGKRIGLPLIGCGYAGGNKERILGIIKEEMNGMDYALVEFVPAPRFKSGR